MSRTPKWIDASLRFRVLDRSDAEGFGRDDPGAVWPEKVTAADVVHDGAEVILVGHRSTQWYSGANNPPPNIVGNGTSRAAHRGPSLVARSRKLHGPIGEVLRGVEIGDELGEAEIVTLFRARGPEVVAIATAADALRRDTVGDD
ncbi:MAG: hypothetical protein ACKO2Q_05890, partial [Actinomycetota bacterium]